jgi:hypothetical protein
LSYLPPEQFGERAAVQQEDAAKRSNARTLLRREKSLGRVLLSEAVALRASSKLSETNFLVPTISPGGARDTSFDTGQAQVTTEAASVRYLASSASAATKASSASSGRMTPNSQSSAPQVRLVVLSSTNLPRPEWRRTRVSGDSRRQRETIVGSESCELHEVTKREKRVPSNSSWAQRTGSGGPYRW